MGSIFSPPKPPPLPTPPPVVTRADPAIAEAARNRAQAEKKRKGRSANIIAGEIQKEAPFGQSAAGAQKLGQ